MIERLKWVDIAKGIAILCVIIGHSITKQKYLWTWNFIYSFHMPLFFLVGGYLFKEKPIKKFFKDSSRRLLVPYFFVAIIFTIYKVLTSNAALKALATQTKTYLYASNRGTEFIKNVDYTGAIWFLAALFVAGFIFNMVLKIKDNRLQFLTIVSLSVLGYLLRYIKYLPWTLDIALVCQSYLYVGFCARRLKADIENLPIKMFPFLIFLWAVFIHNGAMSLAGRFYNDIAIMFFGSISGCIVIFYLSNIINKSYYLNRFLTFCGQQSMTILCVHFLDQKIIKWNQLLNYKSLNTIDLLTCLKLVLLRIFLALTITFIIYKIPIFKYIFSSNINMKKTTQAAK